MRFATLVLVGALGALIAPTANAAQYVYPAKGQDAATQAKDEADCSAWATQQSGFDPAKAAAAPAASSPVSALVGGGAPGLGGSPATAALGAVGGGGGGLGAAAGLLPGGAGQGAMALQAAGALGHMNTHPQAAQAPGQAGYDQARAACLDGRGYSVK
jgi:hypothetical protein